MKRILLLIVYLAAFLSIKAQRPFITTWNTRNTGVSDSTHIIFYATGDNFHVGWINMSNASDTGNVIGTNGSNTISFTAPGIYKVYITTGNGSFSAITIAKSIYNDSTNTDCNKLLSIEQWGDINWSTFNNAFAKCSLMVMNATDLPDLSKVTDMYFAFCNCSSLTTNAAMGNWDVSNVTDMKGLFNVASKFNQYIGNWNTSKVTNISGMFVLDSLFNQPIGNWDVSSVTDMSAMFLDASTFNQPIENWYVSNVNYMYDMFKGASSFNQPIGNWNVGNVIRMDGMFGSATDFNQPIGKWDISKVNSMFQMFDGAISFNQPIGDWDVSNIDNMYELFEDAQSFNQPLGNWNVSKVTNMTLMFSHATSFNQSLGNWKLNSLNTDPFNYSHNMLDSCGMDCANYSSTLKGWAANPNLSKNQFLGAANLIYDSASAKAAHDSLINIYGWTITGDSIGYCSILPVFLLSFTAIKQQQSVLLNWQTANEINNDYFSVERSRDSRTFNEINKIYAEQKQSYTTTDNQPLQGNNYYRLKQVDKDGKFTYSKIVVIVFDDEMKVTVHPNPSKSFIYVDGLNENASSNIIISDATGKQLSFIKTNQSINKINIQNLAAGIYYININQNGKSFRQKFVKQ